MTDDEVIDAAAAEGYELCSRLFGGTVWSGSYGAMTCGTRRSASSALFSDMTDWLRRGDGHRSMELTKDLTGLGLFVSVKAAPELLVPAIALMGMLASSRSSM